MKILHITSWYPTHRLPKTAPWIRQHIEALQSVGVDHVTYHVEVTEGAFELHLAKRELHGNLKLRLSVRRVPWFILEWVAFVFVLWVFLRERKTKYDAINFHIAYPNLVYYRLLKRFIKVPVVVTDHWSAYHLNFGVASPDQLPRIQRIFRNHLPVITVSEALKKDMERFSATRLDKAYRVPNVVDTDSFHFKGKSFERPHQFFMVSRWKKPKDPFAVIEAFYHYQTKHPNATLRIGGFGAQMESMEQLVASLKLQSKVAFLGTLEKIQIAEEMNRATAFIHVSNYETFSVVCAEAIGCGCPVIASNVGGIPEFINHKNGVLLNDSSELLEAMLAFDGSKFDRSQISRSASDRFSKEAVGMAYKSALEEVISSYQSRTLPFNTKKINHESK